MISKNDKDVRLLRNAYLIIAHDNWEQVKLQIRLFDAEYNDVYIHINSAVKAPDLKQLQICARKSKVEFSERTKIVWGEYGIFEAAILLLKKAHEVQKYDYYHLLSGSDLPLKSNEAIQQFLLENLHNNKSEKNLATNYIGGGKILRNPKMLARVTQYNLCVRWWKHKSPFIEYVARKLNRLGYYVQLLLRIDRFKNENVKIGHGSSWWIISNEFAEYVLSKEYWIVEHFKYKTFSADEFIMQTLALNSVFKHTLYKPEKGKTGEANMWEIDWKRGDGKGSPHIFDSNDKEFLQHSENLYARKFDIRVDKEIVKAVAHSVKPDLQVSTAD